MKKIIFLIIIVFVTYVLIIFNFPILADEIGKVTGLTKFNENILKFKEFYDKTVTNFPTKEEWVDTYNKTVSGAIEFKDNVKLGAELTKDKIDGIRETFSGADEKIGEIKETYEEITELIDNTTEKIDKTIEVIDELKTLTNTGVTE